MRSLLEKINARTELESMPSLHEHTRTRAVTSRKTTLTQPHTQHALEHLQVSNTSISQPMA